ncbi:MAG: lysoplasmalogenase [Acidimicrobiia bacterium]|nr:lysoplasmalogenase [Acidimicrobiia bacterium]
MVALVMADRSGSPARAPAKIVASSCFVAIAVIGGATDTTFGTWILVGLALSWLGDFALLGKGRAPFVSGLSFFVLGHVAYVVAFAARPAGTGWLRGEGSLNTALLISAAFVVLVAGVFIARWLLPGVDSALRVPVLAYMAVISTMVIAAVGTTSVEWDTRVLVGAILFYLSDIAVGRDRFVSPGWDNRIVGLPVYYAGQVLLALAAGG